MRNLLLILFFAFMAACSRPAETTTIILSGVVDNPNAESIEFVFYRDFTNNHREIISLELGGQNQFSAEFEMPEGAMGTLRNGRSNILLFLEPGDDLHMEADAGNWIESINFTGKAAAVNTFYVAYQRELLPAVGNSFLGNAAANLSPMEFMAAMDSVANLKFDLQARFLENNSLSPAFVAFFESEVLYDKYLRLLNYPATHQRLNQLAALPQLPEDYYGFLEAPNLFDDSRLNNETYVNFLLAYLNHCAADHMGRFDAGATANEISYTLAGELITGESAAYMQAISINREFNYGKLDKAIAMYNDFMASSLSEEMKGRVTLTWEGIQSLMPGNPAPDFTMTDIDGNQVSLSDFRGKVVYLKFWASWCGPCMRQVPPAAELKKRLADQDDLVFLYVSIDTDLNAWRNTIERNSITGIHFQTPGRERGTPALYQVKWIPTFFIIGKDGSIFDNRPPQPSDANVDEVLLKALAQ
jgi:thiol-disulfide isomerase/thioredoxin